MKPAGGWLRWAWRAWLVYVLVLAALVLLSLPTLYEALRRPCDAATQYCPGMALTPDQFANLQASSLPIELHAALSLAITFAVDSGVGFTLALVLFWRRRDNWAALLLALPIVSHAAAYPGGLLLLEAAHPWLRPLTRLPDFFVLLGWYAAFLVFPDGRFVPRWGRWLLLAAVPAALVTYAIDATEFESPVAAAISTGFALSFVLILAFQIYRYWRVSSPTQQAQARWVIYCFAILLGFLAVIQPGLKLIFPDAIVTSKRKSCVFSKERSW